MTLYLTYESRDSLRSFTLFITAKTFRKLNLRYNDNLEIKLKKVAVSVHVLQAMHNLVI